MRLRGRTGLWRHLAGGRWSDGGAAYSGRARPAAGGGRHGDPGGPGSRGVPERPEGVCQQAAQG